MSTQSQLDSISPDEGRSTVRRAKKDRDHPYLQIRRSTAQDDQLSFEARGVLLYLLSKPEGWTVLNSDLLQQGRIGMHILKRLLKELEQHGYMSRKRVRLPDGKFIWDRVYYEAPDENPDYHAARPQVENQPLVKPVQPQVDLPSVEKPRVDKPRVENQPSYIVQSKQNTEVQKTDTQTEAIMAVGSKFSLEQCQQYARHLHKTGQGINNPGGFAVKLHRTGEQDAQIERFFGAPPEVTLKVPEPNCRQCLGTGKEHVFDNAGKVLGVKPTACACRKQSGETAQDKRKEQQVA
jgi:hypothetical protein